MNLMLKNWNPVEIPPKEELKTRLEKSRSRLYELQLKIKAHKLPVLVLFEGWGASGKGSTIGKIIKNIDPRFFKVATMSAPTQEELRKPFLYRYMKQIPESGKFTFLDSGWMEEIVKDRLQDTLSDEAYDKRIDSIKRFERQLTDNGYLVLKFFMHIEKDEQKDRINKLLSDKDTKWRVSSFDKWQNEHYKKCCKIFDRYLTDTNLPTSPWYLIDSKESKWAELQVLETLVSGIEVALQNPTVQSGSPLTANLKNWQRQKRKSSILPRNITQTSKELRLSRNLELSVLRKWAFLMRNTTNTVRKQTTSLSKQPNPVKTSKALSR